MSQEDISLAVWTALAGLLGLIVGSFLNVAIHRIPLEGEGVGRPRRSRCPSCRASLGWRENIPLLSWLVQAGKCRSCGWRIPARYPLVELLSSLLFALITWRLGDRSLVLASVQCVAIAGLIVASFVDLDHFEIPDEVSLGGIVLAPLISLILPALHQETLLAQVMTPGWVEGAPVDRVGALLGCLAGMAAGGGMLWAIGVLGKRVWGVDAMGFGDVKLLAAGGGFIGPGGAAAALFLASILASILGIAYILRLYTISRSRARERSSRRSRRSSLAVARIAGRYLPFGPYLGMGIGVVLVAWADLVGLMG